VGKLKDAMPALISKFSLSEKDLECIVSHLLGNCGKIGKEGFIFTGERQRQANIPK